MKTTTKKKIVVCCSMKFIDEVVEAKKILENLGHKTVIPKISELDSNYDKLTVEQRIQANHELINNYQKEIPNCDGILVWNQEKNGIPGYIGQNTFLEMVTAFNFNKPIYILNTISPKQNGYEEILALLPININKNLKNI